MSVYRLAHDEARRRALAAVAAAPEGYIIKITPPTRSLEQNALFHAICSKFDGCEWAGEPRDEAAWKVLIVSGHAVATGEGAEIVQGLENEFVNVRESTASMSKKRSASLIEYAQALAAQKLEKR